MNWDAKKRKAQINALPERIGAKQKRLPWEAVSVSATTTGETTVNHSNSLAYLGASPARGVSALHDAAKAQPVSPIEVALGHIDASLRDLRETVQRLSLQLAPVLSPSSGAGQDGQPGGPVPAAQAPLVDRVDALAAQLRKDCAALQDMERRLAL